MSERFRLLFISQLTEPGVHDLSAFAGHPDGAGEPSWLGCRLGDLGLLPHLDYDAVLLAAGEPLPPPGDHDAVILGGSIHSVLEGREWQQRILAWLDDYRRIGGPLLGICGGHQLMAQYLGATVAPLSDAPWAISAAISLTERGRAHPLFAGLGDEVLYQFGNYEHVTAAPAGAEVLATRGASPALALDFGGEWCSVQFHPELTRELMALAWRDSKPDYMANYVESPDAPRLLANFLRLAGLPD